MNKKCTNPACRKVFSTLSFYGSCPHCGKEYPQLVSTRKREGFEAVRILDYNGFKVKAIKVVRNTFQIGLKEAKNAVDHTPDTVYFLERGKADQFTRDLAAFGGTCLKTAAAKPRTETIRYPD